MGTLLREWRQRRRLSQLELAFISTKTTPGTAVDVTVAELSIESFFPADPGTARAMSSLLAADQPAG